MREITRDYVEIEMREGAKWDEFSACSSEDPNLFYNQDGETKADRTQREKLAKAICATCIVRPECLDEALKINERNVFKAGMNTRQLNNYRREMQPQPEI